MLAGSGIKHNDMDKLYKGYLVYTDGRFEYGTKQHHENGEVSINGVRQAVSFETTPSFFLTAEEAAEYLRFLARTKYDMVKKLAAEADRCSGNARHLERTINGQ